MAEAMPVVVEVSKSAAEVAADWSRLAPSVLDLLREGVFVLGCDGRPLGMNRAARLLLREGDGLTLSAQGLLACALGSVLPLRRGIEAALAGRASWLQVARPGRAPLLLRVEPAPSDAGADAAAVLFASDPASHAPDPTRLSARYGFTRTEAGVARRLASGSDLEHIARDLGITLNTVRGHLKQIFGKTRTHRQAELVARILSDA